MKNLYYRARKWFDDHYYVGGTLAAIVTLLIVYGMMYVSCLIDPITTDPQCFCCGPHG